jgi:hypothetical protein
MITIVSVLIFAKLRPFKSDSPIHFSTSYHLLCIWFTLHSKSPVELLGLFSRKSIETGDHIEEFFVDRTLAQAIEGPVQIGQQ